MEITKKEVEKLIGREVVSYKVAKTYRGTKVVKLTIYAQPKKEVEYITVTIKTNK